MLQKKLFDFFRRICAKDPIIKDKSTFLLLVALFIFLNIILIGIIFNLKESPSLFRSGENVSSDSKEAHNEKEESGSENQSVDEKNSGEQNQSFEEVLFEKNEATDLSSQIEPPMNYDENEIILESEQTVVSDPGLLDYYFEEIKESYKDSPEYPLIKDYTESLKEIADGRRAWNSFFEMKTIEFLGEKKAFEVERKIKEANNDKERKIKNYHFSNFEELINAIKKDTASYIEKTAVEGFLDSAKEIYYDRGPWNEAAKAGGSVNLEQAWVDQIDLKMREVKETKARKFGALKFQTVDQLVEAIKNDTQNYKEIDSRDLFLERVKEMYQNGRKIDELIFESGKILIEEYHLQAIRNFFDQ